VCRVARVENLSQHLKERRNEGRKPFEIPKCRREDIRMNLIEKECDSVNWIHFAQVRDR